VQALSHAYRFFIPANETAAVMAYPGCDGVLGKIPDQLRDNFRRSVPVMLAAGAEMLLDPQPNLGRGQYQKLHICISLSTQARNVWYPHMRTATTQHSIGLHFLFCYSSGSTSLLSQNKARGAGLQATNPT
jgi:hypothetical protein